jgi:protoporphyrinogen IX oxidase
VALMLLWIKALHVIAVISWMAGLLYLPRLFVYHAEAGPGTPQAETFKIMEARLLKLIMTPAMLVVWLTGPWLGWQLGYLGDKWFWAKMALVIALTGSQGAMDRWRKELAADQSTRSPKFFRVMNEVPTVLLIAIVVLVIVKPF